MNIYLAGDSIVQNYTEEEFIAGCQAGSYERSGLLFRGIRRLQVLLLDLPEQLRVRRLGVHQVGICLGDSDDAGD